MVWMDSNSVSFSNSSATCWTLGRAIRSRYKTGRPSPNSRTFRPRSRLRLGIHRGVSNQLVVNHPRLKPLAINSIHALAHNPRDRGIYRLLDTQQIHLRILRPLASQQQVRHPRDALPANLPRSGLGLPQLHLARG